MGGQEAGQVRRTTRGEGEARRQTATEACPQTVAVH